MCDYGTEQWINVYRNAIQHQEHKQNLSNYVYHCWFKRFRFHFRIKIYTI